MFEPFFYFLLFFFVVGLLIFSINRNRRKQCDNILNILENRIKFSLYQINCYNFISGLRDRNYFFRHCDLHLTEDAIIILGYSRMSFIKRLSIPIILTKELESYQNNFPFARIVTPKKLNVHSFNKEVFIEFGESDFRSTNVEIRLKDVSEEDKIKIEHIGL